MKKYITLVLLVLIMIVLLAGCSKIDSIPATVEVVTSYGDAYVGVSYNSTSSIPGSGLAIEKCLNLKLDEGETATVHFFCDTCGHDETVTLESPASKLFKCDCPDDGGSLGSKEYFAILIGANTEK